MILMQNRRRQFIVNKPFQYKIILILSAVVVIVALGAHGMAIGYAKLMEAANTSAQTVQIVQNGVSTSDALWLPILGTIFFGILFVLFFGRMYSNKIAGPLFNLKRVMQRVGEGDLSTIMHIRAKDEFHDMEESFNQMVDGLNQRMDNIKQAIADMPHAEKRKVLTALSDQYIIPDKDSDT
jgi:methyl-accepting chemotaxis protein